MHDEAPDFLLLLESEPGAIVVPPQMLRRSHKLRGHGAKIAEALTALQAAGDLPSNLRPTELHKRVCAWLMSAGYQEKELPSRWAVRNFLNSGSSLRSAIGHVATVRRPSQA